MLYMIMQPNEGTIHQVTAPGASEAFELMARHFGYASFDAFCKDLGYQVGDFNLAMVEDNRTASYSEAADRANVEEEYQRTIVNAFKLWRRQRGLGAGKKS